MKTIRWGILSTAKIGTLKVIPALQKAKNSAVVAIASRSYPKAADEAARLGIPRIYGSYEALLDDPEIDAVYNPLPNHLHVPYTLKALAAGKHVLCEKPIALTAPEAYMLLREIDQYPQLKVMEAFMYRYHPQWLQVKAWVGEGAIGGLRSVHTFFSYFNNDPANIRNQADMGGGALMDIGCYCISFPRFLYGAEPLRVVGMIDRDPLLQTDRLTSGMLDFGGGRQATFTCSTQLAPFQRTFLYGSAGFIEVEIPVNAPPDRETRIVLHTGQGTQVRVFPPVDQYTLQGEQFAEAIRNNTPVPTPLSDALDNMRVIDALFQSAETRQWIQHGPEGGIPDAPEWPG
ncbi:MAG TPA: Gfo/Idh/MocA family oxidoreductase [Prolixibacteraceae bacterium]|nr:Gfo/Idh/MocA family oxidoreductase [Prolixibacteraceae bacterium]